MKFKRTKLGSKSAPKIKSNSASSNPVASKHREHAKQFSAGVQKAAAAKLKSKKVGKWRPKKRSGIAAVQKKIAKGELTLEAVLKHNDDARDNALQDTISKMVPSVAGTNLTTGGDNATDIFGQVRTKWNSLQESDKEACAVLAAITESIKEQNAKESPTAYWAALMSTLEMSSANGAEDEKAAMAVVYLLMLVFPHVPVGVLRKQFSKASTVLVSVLTKFAEGSSQALIKSSLGCLASLLAAQELAVWQASNTSQVYKPLLAFAVDSRPKVRKAAHANIETLVKTLSKQSPTHPIIKDTAAFCSSRLKKEEVAMYVLNLLVSVYPTFTPEFGQEIGVRLFQFLTKGERHMKDKCAEIFQAAFDAEDSNLSPKLLDQITEQLFQYDPGLTDIAAKKVWNSIMVTAHVSLGKRNITKSMQSTTRLCAALVASFESDGAGMADHTTQVLCALLEECVKPYIESVDANSNSAPLSQLFAAFEGGLRYRCQKNYAAVLTVIEKLFEIVGKHTYPHGTPITKSILLMRSSKDINCELSIEQAIGASLRAMGPARFLQISPLDLMTAKPKEEFSSAWILPLMKSSISNTELAYFTSNILPIAANLKGHAKIAEQHGNDLVFTTYQTLYRQVWDLLPSFCDNATDVGTSFVGIARTLGAVISGEPVICPVVCQSMITLLKCAESNPKDQAVLANFGKNFLPILFNVFCGENTPDSNKAKSLAAIEAYVPITDPNLTEAMLVKVFAKLSESSTILAENPDDATRANYRTGQQNMLDLCLALSSKIQNPQTLFDVATPLLQDSSAGLQKKAYRSISLICNSERPEFIAFAKSKQDVLMSMAVESMSTTLSAAKQQRMYFLSSLISCLEGPNLREFIPEIIAEVILSCKEVNERARAASFECLIEIGKSIHIIENQPNPAITIKDYFSIVVAGLAGQTPHMMSATIVALSRLIYQFRSEMEDSQIQQVLEGITMLLQYRAREVVKSALGFIKVALAVMPLGDFQLHLEALVLGLVHWSGPAFRMKTRMIFERLIRKFGYDRIAEVTPEEHHKLLTNIKKRKEREKRGKKKTDGADDVGFDDEDDTMDASDGKQRAVHKPSYEELLYDSDDGTDADAEMEEEDTARKGKKNRKGKGSTYIQAENEDDTIDLLDPSLASRIKGEKPKSRKQGGDKAEGLKKAEDGRWIIEDDEMEKLVTPADDTTTKSASTSSAMDIGFDWSKRMSARAGKKRAIQNRGSDDMPGEEDEEPVSKTKASTTRYPGQEYRAKRAAGDVKLKGKQAPYAYIPLDSSMLNRRKRAKAVGDFKSMYSAVKKGKASIKLKKRTSAKR